MFTSQLGTVDSQLGQIVLGWWEPAHSDGHLSTTLAALTSWRTAVHAKTYWTTTEDALTDFKTRLT